MQLLDAGGGARWRRRRGDGEPVRSMGHSAVPDPARRAAPLPHHAGRSRRQRGRCPHPSTWSSIPSRSPIDRPADQPSTYLPVLTGVAEPGGAVELIDELGGMLAIAQVAADGTWSVQLDDPVARTDHHRDADRRRRQRVPTSADTGTLDYVRPTLPNLADGIDGPQPGGGHRRGGGDRRHRGMHVQVFIDGVTTGNHPHARERPIAVTPPSLTAPTRSACATTTRTPARSDPS